MPANSPRIGATVMIRGIFLAVAWRCAVVDLKPSIQQAVRSNRGVNPKVDSAFAALNAKVVLQRPFTVWVRQRVFFA